MANKFKRLPITRGVRVVVVVTVWEGASCWRVEDSVRDFQPSAIRVLSGRQARTIKRPADAAIRPGDGVGGS